MRAFVAEKLYCGKIGKGERKGDKQRNRLSGQDESMQAVTYCSRAIKGSGVLANAAAAAAIIGIYST